MSTPPPAVPPSWASACARLGRAVGAELSRAGYGEVRVTVHALGVTDAFAAGPDARPPGRSLPLHLASDAVIIGPVHRGRPCERCLARRWQSVRAPVVRDAVERGGSTRAVNAPATAGRFTGDVVAAVALARLAEPHGTGAVDVVDLASLMVRRVPLLADPGCPACGRGAESSPGPAVPRLTSTSKPAPGTFRVRRPAEYGLEPDAFVNPVCGALGPRLIRELASPTVCRAGGAFTFRTGEHLGTTQWSGDTANFADSARVGLLEGLERYAHTAAHTGNGPAVVASLSQLGDAALDPRTSGVYAPEAYEGDDYLVPFSPDRDISWVWAYSLRDRRPRLVPEAMAYTHAKVVGGRFTQECSNGCASGGSLTEAVFHGLMEVIERDAFLLAWYGRAELPEIDPVQGVDRGVRELTDRLEMYGYRTRFFDTRMTFPVPVITAVAARTDGGPGALCFGAGAHPLPEAAMAAALSEVATAVPRLPRLTRREEPRLTAMAADFDRVRELNDHWLLYGLPRMTRYADFLLGARERLHPLSALSAGTEGPADDLLTDLRRTVDQVTSQGFDVLVLDQSLPEQRDLGLHTAAVMAPGLLPIDFGRRRQRALRMPRMRTAPRSAGYADRDLRPQDLNPAPHPFP
ncbi:TOMM precursor leader peptide-binding protein [Streptomyces sp. NPDC101150]|uniref:TOMM precursor leader peptide-binding protein n=1 Tax=Streptomyces sp. NPDC101150 TaxID=3366114 RepID=UPI00380CC08B